VRRLPPHGENTPAAAHDTAAGKLLTEVVEAVARRQLETAHNVNSPSAWLAKAKLTIRDDWHGYILEHAACGVPALVDHIEPPRKPPPRDPHSALTNGDGRTFLPGSGWI
jgi:hypothetical protein